MPRSQRTTEEQLEDAERALERSRRRVAELRSRARRERREAMERTCGALARSVMDAVGRPLTDDEVELAAVAATEAIMGEVSGPPAEGQDEDVRGEAVR